jgi:hypothetical protein
MTASELTRGSAVGFAAFLVTSWVQLGVCAESLAAGSEVAPRDASSAPECPTGWYCAAEQEPSDSVPASASLPQLPPPASQYPITALVGRVGWLPLPEQASERAVLLGAGLGLRFRPGRAVAYEAGAIGFFGRDYLGRSRSELGCEANLVLLGSGHRAAGPYVVVGPHLSLARVEGLSTALVQLGGQIGLGGSWPIANGAHSVLAEVDTFVRGRVDAAAAREPEYRDPSTGAPSNGALGVILRLGFATEL